MEELFHAAGVPKDAYINIYATNEQIAEVIADPRVQGVSLTGSGRAGAAVAEVAGRNLKKVVLELGGSDPFIVLKADDLDAVVEAAVGGRLENTGQACNAAKRFIVVDDLYEEFTEKFTAALSQVQPGDPSSPDTTIGPLSSAGAAERLESQLKQALEGGATLLAGGEREGNFFKTTVITDVKKDNPAYTEEFFGPVAQIFRVANEEEAIRQANDTPYGLGSYVFTTDEEQALRVADRLEAGMVFVNAVGAEGVELPFGGVKASGFGRELGRSGADEFVNKKLIRIAG
jgi:succinate-semialdehyde dehydrogenase/glutarate-semialdehyde dehydrogenase